MKRWYFAGGILLLIICVMCMGIFFLSEKAPVSEVESQVAAELKSENIRRIEQGREHRIEPETKPGAVEVPYKSPIDFESLQAQNPDIYAWLYIPDADISYPLLQSETDDTFYLNHNSKGEPDKNGALFSESRYNSREFTDPVTVIYGHHMRSGAMFGRLQALYSEEDGLEKYRNIYVYLPNGEQKYEVFAAVPFGSDHILYYYDFSDEGAYEAFLDDLGKVRHMNAKIDQNVQVSSEDQLLLLSTCLSGNNKKRYLVLAKRTDNK